MSAGFDDIPEIALGWHKAGRGAILATVIETWGSAPRPTGSQLAISGDGEIAGSVSGGCVEGAVVAEAIEALSDGKRRVLEYGIADEDAFAVGLACGGDIKIMVEPVGGALGADLLVDICAARAAREPIAYVVNLENNISRLSGVDDVELAGRFRSDKSGMDGDEFVGIHNPPLRMAVVGAVHIAQPLMQMARLSGYDAILVDPREAFASAARFPDTLISHDWPDEALLGFGLDARTAVVTLTHDPKLDDPAIVTALGSDAFYVGCLGSKRTHAKRLERLAGAGVSVQDLARIHGPVGLNIGAKTPAEIAVAVMGQITEVLRAR